MVKTINIFSEVRYYPYSNVNIMVIFDHHYNIIAAVLGLETLLSSKNSVRTAQSQYIGTMQTPN